MNIVELGQILNGDGIDEFRFWLNFWDSKNEKFDEKYLEITKKLCYGLIDVEVEEIAKRLTEKGLRRLDSFCGEGYSYSWNCKRFSTIDIDSKSIDKILNKRKEILVIKELLKYEDEYRNDTFREYVSKLSVDERYDCLSLIKVYVFKNPNQTIFKKNEVEEIIKIIKDVDLESSVKRMSVYEKGRQNHRTKVNKHLEFLLNIKPRGWQNVWGYFEEALGDLSHKFNAETLACYLLMMNKEEILPFIENLDLDFLDSFLDNFEKSLVKVLEMGQKEKNEELISKCNYFIDTVIKKRYRDVYKLIDVYKNGDLTNYIKEVSDNPNIIYGLKNQVILFYFRNKDINLFTYEDLKQIIDIFKEIEFSLKEQRISAIFLAENYSDQVENQKLPSLDNKHIAFGNWKMMRRMFIDGDEISNMIEFFLIMTKEEIFQFAVSYYNVEDVLEKAKQYCLEQDKNKVRNDNLYKELAVKIDDANKMYHQALEYHISYFKKLYQDGRLVDFISRYSDYSKDNLKDFLRLSGVRYGYQIFTFEELKDVGAIIDDSKYRLLEQRKTENLVNLDSINKLLGLNDRTQFKKYLCDIKEWNNDNSISVIVEFLSVLEVYEIAELLDYNILRRNDYCILENILLEKGNSNDIVNKLKEAQKEKNNLMATIDVSAEEINDYLKTDFHKNILKCVDDLSILEYIYSIQQNIDNLVADENKKYIYLILMILDYIIYSEKLDHIIDKFNNFDFKHIRIVNIPIEHFISKEKNSIKSKIILANQKLAIEEIKRLFKGSIDKKRGR